MGGFGSEGYPWTNAVLSGAAYRAPYRPKSWNDPTKTLRFAYSRRRQVARSDCLVRKSPGTAQSVAPLRRWSAHIVRILHEYLTLGRKNETVERGPRSVYALREPGGYKDSLVRSAFLEARNDASALHYRASYYHAKLPWRFGGIKSEWRS